LRGKEKPSSEQGVNPVWSLISGDGKDNILIAITGTNGNGFAIVDLTSLSEPAPLPYLKDVVEIAHAPGSNERSALRATPGNQANGTTVQGVVPRSVIKDVANEEIRGPKRTAIVPP
jgi:uncharacterized membrane protein